MGAIAAELVETGEKRDARGRRVTPAERRAQMVQAFQRSGLTMAAFARREGVKYPTFAGWVVKAQRSSAPKGGIKFHTFVKWLQRRRRTAGTGAKQTPRFQELSLPFMARASGTLEVSKRRRECHVARGTAR